MRMKLLLIGLLLLPLLFAADWRTIGGLAIVTSAIILGMVYAVGYGMGINELKFLATEEFYQLIATIFMIGLIIGVEASLNEIGTGLVGDPFPDAALNIIGERLENQEIVLNSLQDVAIDVGRESSKSSFCTIYGTGISMSPCGSYRALTTPISLSYQVVAVGVAELGGLETLVRLGKEYAFLMLLPTGILLRTFRITRGAGGLMMGFALTLYLLVPLGIVAMEDLNTQAREDMEEAGRPIPELGELADVPECEPTRVSEGNYNNAEGIYNDLRDGSRAHIYEFLVNATITTLVTLSILVAGLHAMASLAGAEVDVSALARLA